LPSNIASKFVGTELRKPSWLTNPKKRAISMLDKKKFDNYRLTHLTDREKHIEKLTDIMEDNLARKNFFRPTKENMDFIIKNTTLPNQFTPKVNPYFNGKFNQLNNFSK
jgi:hypothetical protein